VGKYGEGKSGTEKDREQDKQAGNVCEEEKWPSQESL